MKRKILQTLLTAALLFAAAVALRCCAAGPSGSPRQCAAAIYRYSASDMPEAAWGLDIVEGHIGPPTEDMYEEVFEPSKIRLFLERYEYRRVRFYDRIPEGGVLIREWDGCFAPPRAYWDGQYLWFAEGGRDWYPHLPSTGFAEELQEILEKYSFKMSKTTNWS